MINQSELGIQGFVASTASTSDTPEPSPQSQWEEVESIEIGSRTFHVGHCYNYLKKGAAYNTPIWIWEFASETMAYYCEARPSNATFLGATLEPPEGTNIVNQALFEQERAAKLCVENIPVENVKIVQKKPLFLADLGEEIPNPSVVLPEWTYIRRRKNNSLRFGYIYQPTATPPRREGLQRKNVRVLELFAGAGLMHQGFASIQGFKTVAAVEIDKVAVKTFKKNNPGVPVFAEDVRTFLQRCQSDQRVRERLGSIGVLHASPPCQGFSCANIYGGQNDEANNNLSLVWLEYIKFFRPLVATFENVAGMWRAKHLHYLKHIQKELLNMGYQFRMDVLRACDFGDPQIRPRLVIIASQKHVPLPNFPAPTHGNKESGLLPYVTVSQVLEGFKSTRMMPMMGCALPASRNTINMFSFSNKTSWHQRCEPRDLPCSIIRRTDALAFANLLHCSRVP